jgi:hypothetical protein
MRPAKILPFLFRPTPGTKQKPPVIRIGGLTIQVSVRGPTDDPPPKP